MSCRIALVGPDGTGKTTVARRIVAELPWPARYIYMGVNPQASNIMLPTTWLLYHLRRLLGLKVSMGGPPALEAKPAARWRRWLSTPKSLLRIMHLMADEWFRQLVCWIMQRRGKTVIMDRHFFLDYFAHDVQPPPGTRGRRLASRVHGWMLKNLYPKPDFVVFLDADAAELFRRKPEGTVAQLQHRRNEYLQAREQLPHSVLIDVNQSLDQVVKQAIAAITAFRNRRRQENEPQPNNESTGNSRPAALAGARQTQTQSTIPAVIVGLDCYTGLQTARIFSSRGIPVIGIAENPRHFGCRSRTCREIVSSPTRTIDLIQTLERIGADLPHRAVLVPCIDMSVLLISQHRQRLERYFHIALPDESSVDTLLDKTQFAKFAEQHGFDMPRSITISTREEAVAVSEQLTFPCLIKPAIKTDLWERTVKTKVFKVYSPQQMVNRAAAALKVSPQLVVQEWIEGSDADLYTCNCYFDQDSRPLATFVSQKLRQWPPEIGVASLARECDNQEVRNLTVQLLQLARFHGLGYVEMKRDCRTGRYYLIEANIGRPTGRSALAEAAGVELLATMHADLLDLPLPASRQQRRCGVKWRYWRKDICAALHYWRLGELSLLEWWKSVRGPTVDAVFTWSDPWPFVVDLLGAVRKKRQRVQSSTAAAATELARPGVS